MALNKSLFFISSFLILNFFALSSLAQSPKNNYETYWEKVKQFEDKGLATSAINEVNIIYNMAKKDKNEAQVIKSLLYINQLSANITEDATKKMIDTLQQEITKASEPAKSILQSITAQLYQNYFSDNRYRLYSVSNTQNFQKDDIATWSADDFKNRIAELFESSIQNKNLQKISLESFDAFIDKGNVRYLRPTLYDLLAHRALDYFKSSENDISRPAYSFEITDKDAFAPAKEFIKATFDSKDSGSLHLKALQTFQELIRLHIKEVTPLMDVDLERLEFVNQNAVMVGKRSLYIDALKNIFENTKDTSAAEAGFRWAQQVYQGSKGNINDQHKSSVKKSADILQMVISKYPESEGGVHAKNLLAEIKHPALSIQSEKVNVKNKPFRTLVSYKNIDLIYLRIIPVTKRQKSDVRDANTQEKQFQLMSSMKFARQWQQDLPELNDYAVHNVEIKIDQLESGEYILLASKDKSFSTGKNLMAADFIFVSNISFINNGKNYFVLDRESGKPIPSADVKILRRNYNYNTRKYHLSELGHAKTDRNGFFRIPNNIPDNLYNIRLDIRAGKDQLFLDDEQRLYAYNPYTDNNKYKNQEDFNKNNATIFFFTDRSIYRPGQTVYYKGIGVTKDLLSRKSRLLQTNESLHIYLFNANGEKVDSATVTLNEYGSFNGKFVLPQNQLTGNFRIQCKEFARQSMAFSVEEYKRPKFFAEFEKAKESYKVNDTVHITGKAEAYAGNNIDGANVTYRVTREARFIYPWRFWKFGFPNVSPLEITHGETTTDENGNFKIDFKAIPDLSLDPKTDPVFDYKIAADVTDINGETRSATITIPVGYKALDLQLQLANKGTFIASDFNSITITGKNLSGEPQKISAELKIYQLQTPDRVLRERFWPAPDTFVMPKSEFIKYFPHDVYKDESNPETWEKKQLVIDRKDSINGSEKFSFNKELAGGWYVAEVTSADRYGNPVKDVKYFQVLKPGDKNIASPDYLLTATAHKDYEPGEIAKIHIGTASDIFLIQQKDTVTHMSTDTIPDVTFYTLKDEVKTFTYSIKDNDRGGFGIVNFFVKDNRLYYDRSIVNVPWTNKKLDITFDTYRDKTLPGSEETWKVTIAGYKGEKLAAEMLASMYDASLDQFKPHSWNQMNIWPTYNFYTPWQGNQNFTSIGSFNYSYNIPYLTSKEKNYDEIKYLESPVKRYLQQVVITSVGKRNKKIGIVEDSEIQEIAPDSAAFAAPSVSGGSGEPEEKKQEPSPPVQPVRTNFNETAFFYPELKTDKDGNISFSFTMPEALTQWKLMAQAHTKDLAIGYAEKLVVTQKDLMVVPNVPRFFREGDKMLFSAKVVNMTDHEISGNAEFHLLNAATMNPVNDWFKNVATQKSFTIAANQSKLVNFSIEIPQNFNEAVVYRIVASADNMSDGEEAFVPVVTNRMLVTETMPLSMKGNGTKNFSFEKLLKSGKSSSLANYGLTVEYTPNPVWYAVQALPYLNSYPYDCTEQVFNRYFANALAMNIANSSPKIKEVFEKWKIQDTAALMSNLQKNQELKSVLLEETPWVLQAKTEEQQKKNIALLFDVVNMSSQLNGSLKIVKDRQSPNGGFVWFKNGPDDRYMTQYIIADIGHLKNLNAWPQQNRQDLTSIVSRALPYLDSRIAEDYQKVKKGKVKPEENHLTAIAAHYLYARSFFPDIKVSSNAVEAYNYYLGQAKKYWLKQSIYNQGMIALALFRSGDTKTANDIVKSLKQNAIVNEELGMYWKAWDQRGWWWYQAPIESQSLMIEVFNEVATDQNAVTDLKTWLLKNKQTNNWKTTKATAEAVYALLLQGTGSAETGLLSQDKNVQIKLGSTILDNKNEKQEAGTGYFKRMIDGVRVKPEMGNISVTVSQPGVKDSKATPSWGSVYWQYFEDLDKITFAETPLKLSKKLFVETNTDKGPVLTPVNDGDKINVGNKIKVRIELRVDRDMEYVHMKDMRASAMEPVNVLSQYKWQGGLGYYESTKDVSTNFFFNYLPKGTYVFEYPMFVTHSGDFSNGVTTIQCMYAPEFTAHSEGVRVRVNEKL